MDSTYAIGLTAVAVVAGVVYFRSSSTDDGVKALLKLPIISDLHSSPIKQPLKNWDAWCKAKGAVATPKLFGIVPIVVINTSEAATELLSKRSAWYSNRPSSVSVEMITGADAGQSKFTLMHDMDDVRELVISGMARTNNVCSTSDYTIAFSRLVSVPSLRRSISPSWNSSLSSCCTT